MVKHLHQRFYIHFLLHVLVFSQSLEIRWILSYSVIFSPLRRKADKPIKIKLTDLLNQAATTQELYRVDNSLRNVEVFLGSSFVVISVFKQNPVAKLSGRIIKLLF